MTTQVALPLENTVLERVAADVHQGLTSCPKRLPPWLFYDQAGSRLFDEITELTEYYLTRTERSILRVNSDSILTLAAGQDALRVIELGAGTADKTRLLLEAALRRGLPVRYEPVDVSASALEAACRRIECEIPGVEILPRVMDYTGELDLAPSLPGERRLVLYIGSSIGNFEPREAIALLRRMRSQLNPGDGLLLGVDLVKDPCRMLPAYDDPKGVTAAFNLNLLNRLNRELGANFPLGNFAHRAIWNQGESRMEMHLESLVDQEIQVAALDLDVPFAQGETIHTENSYKFPTGGGEAMLAAGGFVPRATWTDARQWFALCLGQV